MVVLTNGSAVAMPWVDTVPAIVEGWLGGQAGAGAVADVVFGKVNPSGKLAETFPVRLEDTPAFLNFPGEDGEVLYGERIFVRLSLLRQAQDRAAVSVRPWPFLYGVFLQ